MSEGRLLGLNRFAAVFIVLLAFLATAEAKQKLYVPVPHAEDGKSYLRVFDPQDKSMISEIPTVKGSSFARLTPDGSKLWVFSWSSSKIEIFETATDRLVGEVWLNAPICDAVFHPSGNQCYVANGSYSGKADNSVTFVDAVAMSATYTIVTGKNPVALAISLDGSRLFAANHDDNSITVINTRDRTVDGTMYAGLRPYSVTLSPAGRYLFVANQGIKQGRAGGSSVTVLDPDMLQVVYEIDTGKSVTDLVLNDDATRMLVLHNRDLETENLWMYGLSYENGILADASPMDKLSADISTRFISLSPEKGTALLPDLNSGRIGRVPIQDSLSFDWYIASEAAQSYQVVYAEVQIDAQIAELDSVIAEDPMSIEAQNAYFEKAYLYRTAGDLNSVIAVYNEIVENYPNTQSQTRAFFKLGDLCYEQDLVSNAADYYNRGLTAYGELLETSGGQKKVDAEILLKSAERLAELSRKTEQDYFKDLFKLYEDLPARLEEFPQLFFTFGVALKRADEDRYARRCFEETENRMIELMDEEIYREMKSKLALVRGERSARTSSKEIKSSIVVDGRLDEWRDFEPLVLARRDDVIVNYMRWLDESDASGTFYNGHDEYNLYVAGDIRDDRVFRTGASGDYLGIYLDIRDGAGNFVTRDGDMDNGVYMIKIVPPASQDGEFKVSSEQNIQPVLGGSLTEGGWSFELRIPLAYLAGLDPRERDRIGFGVEIFDVDTPGSNDPPKIVGWVMPASSVHGPRDSRMFGILEF